MIGQTRQEFGGSHYALLYSQQGGKVPQANPNALTILRKLHTAIRNGWIASCHDLSEGGLGVAIAEMCIGGRLGASITIAEEWMLFSESLTRFIIEVKPEYRMAIEQHFADSHSYLGQVTQTPELVITSTDSVHRISVQKLEEAWRGLLMPKQAHNLPYQTTSKHVFARTPSTKTHKPRVLLLHAN
ncbi:MAG: hypothetical protein CUN52_15130, partial [Phototrophicales bacterium]